MLWLTFIMMQLPKIENLDKLKAALEEESFKAELDEIENGDME